VDTTRTNPEAITELQRQLAASNAERDEALAREQAVAEVLQVINSSPGELAPVFDAILEKAHTLCGADHGALSLFDAKNIRAVAVRSTSDAFAKRLREGIPLADNPLGQPLLQGAFFVHIPDIAQIDHPVMRAAIEQSGTRTALAVPLRKDSTVLGAITAVRQEVRPFTDKQIALLQSFAAQAVIAMENSRLLTETREALEQQTATAELLRVINSSPGDLAPVFEAMLEKATRLCDAPCAILWLYEGSSFRPAAVRGVPQAFVDYLRLALNEQPLWSLAAITRGEAYVHSLDLSATETYRGDYPLNRAVVDLGGARTGLLVPLSNEGTLIGAIRIYRQEVRQFSDTQIVLLQNFAAQAVIAIENARLLGELRQRTEEVAELNRGLEARVAEQVEELGRVGRLKRFLAPQLAELIVSQGDENILESHRREIVVVFCDLRGYTAFTETAEPEEVLDFLREYHGALGPLVSQYEGTLDQFSGDGIMVFFNDPVPIPDATERAVRMATAMREAAAVLISGLRRRGGELGFGVGIAQGYATLGQIGFSERSGYTAIGTVCNVAARLCSEARDGQILLSQRLAAGLGDKFALEEIGVLALKGLTRPMLAFNVIGDTRSASEKPKTARTRNRGLKIVE
jgi:class 3 adenylate cyclase